MRSSRGGFMIATAILAVLVLGGAAVAVLRTQRGHATANPDATAEQAPAAAPLPAAPSDVAVPAPAPSASPTTATPSLTPVGASDLGRLGGNADIHLLDGFAYIGGYTGPGGCPGHGVRIIDLADPANPTVVATAAGVPGTTSEDIVALRVSTPHFRGDLLAVGIQRCGQ